MPTRASIVSRIPRVAPLATCLAAALGLTLSTAQADDRPPTWVQPAQHRSASAFELPAYLREHAAKPYSTSKHASNRQPTPRVVTTCADDGSPGTLREQVYAAVSGDTIDLSQLMCSTITLDPARTPPEIEVNQDSLYLKGPAAGAAYLTIDAGHHSSVFQHFGTGTLGISNLTITNGYYSSDNYARGGCVSSSGNVTLIGSVVSHCILLGTSNTDAKGAGLYVKGNLALSGSTITDCLAFATNGYSFGGGAFTSGDLVVKYSTIGENTAYGGYTPFSGVAGGVFAGGNSTITSSTISGNYGQAIGALALGSDPADTATITNSTISGNAAMYGRYGGIFAGAPLTVTSSTIAFNHGSAGGHTGAGLFSHDPLSLQSSIIAGNFGADGPSDLGGTPGITVTGADNLITSSTLAPLPGTIADCPQLEPLANNGGTTLTHALRQTSPAIDQGNAGTLTEDQRLAPRIAGAAADIGSVEWQPGETDERVFVNGFDGLCDQ